MKRNHNNHRFGRAAIIALGALGILVFCGAGIAHAAVLTLTPSPVSASVGQSVRVAVTLDTQGASANAVQGSVFFPPGLLSLQLIDTGSSMVNFWVTPPEQTSSGEIDFAGIIPGGFNGSSGPIVAFTFNPVAPGAASLTLASATVLANDGKGSDLPVAVSGTSISISSAAGAIPAAPPHSVVAPDSFTPQIEQNPDFFNGQYFLVFGTIDKGTGIDHYEVMEVPTGWLGWGTSASWQTATSPYVLGDQSLSSNIYVRAVDHAGNFIVVSLPARHPRPSFGVIAADAVIAGLIIVVAFCIWLFKRRRRL
ncbi:MAG TPA: cohesin domain-containing protein [Candidatus Paceibacterota bacterium]|nr:cohesin domain-containing protein [Candidatus Paceibacterota bacterium]